ncbi:hypothetical protein AJ80_08052 [Polytolypa hystricis UAMH7299]|uniref:Methyltransferase n=1 Tax=Polytolypa hystricis (strain UAMH7299) TaxID=1447883 RepID=A0A2B7X631_POLH7|nr:hypothetical protein AJ80_08052 [Polytolypa hystricis UAMH7299]
MSATATEPAATTTLHGSNQDANYIPRGPVEAVLTYFVPPADGAAPFNYVEKPPPGKPPHNYGTADHNVTINDIRGHETEYSLDQDAFEVLQNIPSAADPAFTDDENIQSVYYPEVEKVILENVPGAKRVFIFDHTIRRSHPGAARGPVTRTHIDQTVTSAALRVKHHLPDEAEELLKGRYRIINVWRPLNGPVQAKPLAFASSVSVRDEDLVPVEHRYPTRTGETASVKFNEEQKWYYLSGMLNDERLLLKCSDSGDVPGKRVPHSAFVDPRTPPGARGRESIEVRTLVFG